MKPYLKVNFVALTILVSVAFANLGASQHLPEWRKLVPLVSTIQDVEKVLGNSAVRTYTRIYTTQEVRFVAYYQLETCEDTGLDAKWKWRVKPGTLIQLFFLPNPRRSPETYEPKLNTFKRTREQLVQIIYKSADESVHILASRVPGEGERAFQVSLVPSKEQQILRCKPLNKS